MKPVIYIRNNLADSRELEAASKYFEVVDHRAAIKPGSLVIPRYAALPYYLELERDMEEMGCVLINSHREHSYVADIQNWYYDLKGFTPKTWFRLEDLPETGPFVVKGATNSKKFQWNTHMFAETKIDAVTVACKLSNDGLISEQPIYAREYVPLKKLAQGLNGLSICEEYRFFVLDGEIVDSGFYWSSHIDDLSEQYTPSVVPQEFIDQIISKVGQNIRFWVFDVARTATGDWTVIELNDGQQSGLSEVNPDNFYRTLSEKLTIC